MTEEISSNSFHNINCPVCGEPLHNDYGEIRLKTAIARLEFKTDATCINMECPIISIMLDLRLSLMKLRTEKYAVIDRSVEAVSVKPFLVLSKTCRGCSWWIPNNKTGISIAVTDTSKHQCMKERTEIKLTGSSELCDAFSPVYIRNPEL